MTIEEEFFKTFGIEPFIYCCKPRLDCPARKVGTCTKECEYYSGMRYPEITDRILLELICILGTVIKQFKIPPHLNIKTLRGHILRNCINRQEGIYTRVRSLFEEK